MVFPNQPPRGPKPRQPQQIFPNQRPSRGPAKKQNGGWQPLLAKGVDGVSKTLNNVQQVLNVVQSTTPIIQQYGPMVKNIPAMYRMLKAFKEVESSDTPESAESTRKQNNQVISSANTKKPDTEQDEQSKRVNNSGQSTPKLFI